MIQAFFDYTLMMDQKDFDRILKKYLHGEETDEERRLVEDWYASIGNTRPQLSQLEKWRLKWSMWQKVKAHKLQRTPNSATADDHKVRPIYTRAWVGSIAAALAAAIVISIVWLQLGKHTGLREDLQTLTNPGTSDSVVLLADGSRVSLSPGSKLQIAKAFNKSIREVILTGKGFFEVKRDTLRPFYVYTTDVTTKVLGTSFTVNAINPDVVVSVRTGRVSVSGRKEAAPKSKDDAEIILTPNQQAIYNAGNGTLSRILVEEPIGIIHDRMANTTVSFESEEVPSILDELSKSYGIAMEYDRALLNSCTLSTSIDPTESIYERLDIICDAINATYRVEGVVIKISGKGCKGKNH